MFRQKRLAPTSITITGGDTVTRDRGNYRVPKRDLFGVMQMLLQSERLKVAEGFPRCLRRIEGLLKVSETAVIPMVCGADLIQQAVDRSRRLHPEFPVSSCLDPGYSPSSTRAIVVLLTNAVNLPIKLTNPSGGVVNQCSMGSGGGFHYVTRSFPRFGIRSGIWNGIPLGEPVQIGRHKSRRGLK